LLPFRIDASSYYLGRGVLFHAIACWRRRPHAWLAKGPRASRAQDRNVQAAAVRKEQWCVLEKEANQSATT